MSIRVYINYEGEGAPAPGREIMSQRLERDAHKLKVTLPEKWLPGPCEKLLSFFCDTYNKKFPEKPLVAAEMLLKIGDVVLPLADAINRHVNDYNDVFVLHRPKPVAVVEAPAGSVRCTNFGCGKSFVPPEAGGEVDETACHHHKSGPVFHDTAKFWGCCPERKGYDWEEFERIPTCCVSAHSSEERGRPLGTVTAGSIDNVALTADQIRAAQQSAAPAAAAAADGPRRTGPREFESAKAASADLPGPIAPDGTGKCRNFGCQQTFVVADNHAEACTHHTGGPVFWDTYKYWACCPTKKYADFDDFVKVAGCTVGFHKL